MPRKKQQSPVSVSEKPNNKEPNLNILRSGSIKGPDVGILSSERIEQLFGLVAEGESQPEPSTSAKSKRQIKKDRNAKRSTTMKELWAKRKAVKEGTIQVPNKLEPLLTPKESVASRFVKVLKRTKTVKVEQEVPGNGHKPEGDIPVAVETQVAVSPFKYEGWQPQEIPSAFGHMTPHWLWRRIHWEEQAKIARVKPSGLSPALKIGAAIAVLLLFLFVIFMFGVIIMGGGSK